MAAKDHAGVQEFPQAKFIVPSQKELEEQVSMALNLKDGQQSAGQSVDDPYTRAVRYLNEHGIVDVLQVRGYQGNGYTYLPPFFGFPEYHSKTSLREARRSFTVRLGRDSQSQTRKEAHGTKMIDYLTFFTVP